MWEINSPHLVWNTTPQEATVVLFPMAIISKKLSVLTQWEKEQISSELWD